MLPTSVPAITATSPARQFRAIVKYSSRLPRRAMISRLIATSDMFEALSTVLPERRTADRYFVVTATALNALPSKKQSFQHRAEDQGGKVAQCHHRYQTGRE